MENNKRPDGRHVLEDGTHVIVPTVHLNGTSGDQLHAELCDVLGAVREARYALQRVAPHGRDYYTQDPANLGAAMHGHKHRIQRLHDIEAELVAIAGGIQAQLDAKAGEEVAVGKAKWNGLCPAGRHGLDHQGQRCDLCATPDVTYEDLGTMWRVHLHGEAARAWVLENVEVAGYQWVGEHAFLGDWRATRGVLQVMRDEGFAISRTGG